MSTLLAFYGIFSIPHFKAKGASSQICARGLRGSGMGTYGFQVPKLRGPFWGVPAIRLIVFLDYIGVPPILGNYQMVSEVQPE